jgi:hypothetical protein
VKVLIWSFGVVKEKNFIFPHLMKAPVPWAGRRFLFSRLEKKVVRDDLTWLGYSCALVAESFKRTKDLFSFFGQESMVKHISDKQHHLIN